MIDPVKVPLILMAEDDADDRLLAKDALAESGTNLELRFVDDGVELMDYLHRRNKYARLENSPRPGLILLDLNMPRKDGREALREIKADPELKRIPVVVLTTSTAPPDISSVYELGASSFIAKPVAFKALVNLLKTLADYWFNVVVLPSKAL